MRDRVCSGSRVCRQPINRRVAIVGLMLWAAASRAAPPSGPLAEWAAEWQRLRRIQGHFDGGAWSDEVDRFGGAKQVLMQRLSGDLVRRRVAAAEVETVLGRPDSIWQPGDDRSRVALARLVETLPSGYPVARLNRAVWWLYQWRGRRDQLVLALHRGRVVGSGWLHDWE